MYKNNLFLIYTVQCKDLYWTKKLFSIMWLWSYFLRPKSSGLGSKPLQNLIKVLFYIGIIFLTVIHLSTQLIWFQKNEKLDPPFIGTFHDCTYRYQVYESMCSDYTHCVLHCTGTRTYFKTLCF